MVKTYNRSEWKKLIKYILFKLYILNMRYVGGYYIDYCEQNNILI
jgi:hypothetical protein